VICGKQTFKSHHSPSVGNVCHFCGLAHDTKQSKFVRQKLFAMDIILFRIFMHGIKNGTKEYEN
jgi:hypothetical protein